MIDPSDAKRHLQPSPSGMAQPKRYPKIIIGRMDPNERYAKTNDSAQGGPISCRPDVLCGAGGLRPEEARQGPG